MSVTTYNVPDHMLEVIRIVASSMGFHSWVIHVTLTDRPALSENCAMAIRVDHNYLNADLEIARYLDYTVDPTVEFETFLKYLLHEFMHLTFAPFSRQIHRLVKDDEFLKDEAETQEEQAIQQFIRSAIHVWKPFVSKKMKEAFPTKKGNK